MKSSVERPGTDHVAWLTGVCPVAKFYRHADQEPIHDYVAQLQLHMTLQARKLVPTHQAGLSPENLHDRQQLLAVSQADAERLVSRLAFK